MKKFAKKVIPVLMAGIMVAGMAIPSMAAEDPWSIANAEKESLTYLIDGEKVNVTWYADNYLKDTGELSADDYKNAKVNVYVPEGANATSPILYMVDNSGWRSNAYSDKLLDPEVNYVTTKDGKQNFAAMALAEGYVVVNAGLRTRGNVDGEGNFNHSPVTVADAKAVIRYLKHNDGIVGDTDYIFITGTSGGGALSVAIGANGNSEDFYEELYAIGAAGMESRTKSTIDDDIFGVVAYCPITDLAHSDGSYEFTYANARTLLVDTGFSTTTTPVGMPAEGQYTLGVQSLTMSPVLAKEWTTYVDSLKIAGVTVAFDEATKQSSGTLYETMEKLLIESLQRGLDTLGAEKFEAALKDRQIDAANYIQDTTNPNFDPNWQTSWLEYTDATKTKIKDIDIEKYLYYVALQQNIKPAPAFTNDGLGLKGVFYNENNLFGKDTEKHGYLSQIVFEASDMTGAYADWNAYWTENGALITKQAKMVDSIQYLVDGEGESDSAPYWWVRHGSRDRDTGFANQTLLYFAMNSENADLKTADFEFEFGRGHEGAYNIPEAKAFMKASLDDAGYKFVPTTPQQPTQPSTPESPKTGNNMMPLFAVVVAAGAVALASTRRRVVR